jgi:hypothetical protein
MSNQTLSSSEATAREGSTSWLPLIIICLAQILVVLNPSVTNTAIGSIVADLNTPATTVQTGLMFYSLVTAGLSRSNLHEPNSPK